MIFQRGHGAANIATIVKRKTRYTVLLQNNDRRSRSIMQRLIDAMAPLILQARQSITSDRGFEFTARRGLYRGIRTASWFCDPQSPWQKGTVENTNRRLRRHLPYDTALLPLSRGAVQSVADQLNTTSHKCLCLGRRPRRSARSWPR
ncbi:IS30 family transposase [Aestuariibius insulae]|uniref:IS30 family transposase n=1 Tax=Aestuariibius insulae TaxID=2058287 RepID=UPI00345E3755